MDDIHVLFLPSFYFHGGNELSGPFFRDQALCVMGLGVRPAVAFVEPRSLRDASIRSLRNSHFQISCESEGGLVTLRQHGWNPFIRATVGGLIWSWLTQRLVDRYVRRFGVPDLIHAHNSLWAGYSAAGVSKKYSIPFCITEHSTAFPTVSIPRFAVPFVRRAYSKSGTVIAVSRSIATSMLPYMDGRNPVIIPNVVDTDFFGLPFVPRGRSAYVFLGIGHLTARKGFHVLVEAFAKAFSNNPGVYLEIGGDGPERERLQRLCHSLGIENRVRLLGALSRTQVREAMWRANAFVLPSLVETFGVVLIEALATGLPVVSTYCGGPEEIVSPEVGILVKPGHESELGRALKDMYVSNLFSSQAARAYAIRRYGQKSVGAMLLDTYSKLLRGFSPSLREGVDAPWQ